MRKGKEEMEHSEKQVCKNCISVKAGIAVLEEETHSGDHGRRLVLNRREEM